MTGSRLPPTSSHADVLADRTAQWWSEAWAALQAGRVARARRFLRWVLAVHPDDEQAWLQLARLGPAREDEFACLRQARRFQPTSPRLRAAPRDAWSRPVPDTDPLRRVPAAPRRPARIDPAAWLAWFLPLLVYLLTLCPTVYNLDSAEFSAAAYSLGLVRATGYPLYLLLGKVFTLLPAGDVGFRLNLMSAVCAAGTAGLLYRLVRRLTGQRAAALAAALLLASSYYFWAQAVVAEVYGLHTLFLVALILLLLQWEETRADIWLGAFALLYGLSFGNHMSSILLAPAFALFILLVGRSAVLRPRPILLLLVPFVAGLSVYLYLPLRYLAQPAFNYAGQYTAQGEFAAVDLRQPANVLWLMAGQGFQHLMFDYAPRELLAELGRALWRLWAGFLGIGLVPGLLGAWVLLRRSPRHLALLGLIFAANLVFFAGYRIPDKETMFLPVYVIWAVWIGIGFGWLVRWVEGRRAVSNERPRWAWALAAMAIVVLVVNWPRVDLSDDTRARDQATAALGTARPNAVIFGWWTSVPAMQYEQIVEKQRPDVLVINRFLIDADEMYALIDRSLGRRPVYVMELDDGLTSAYRPLPVGPMFELLPRQAAWSGQ